MAFAKERKAKLLREKGRRGSIAGLDLTRREKRAAERKKKLNLIRKVKDNCLPALVSGKGVFQFLTVSKLPSGTGEA